MLQRGEGVAEVLDPVMTQCWHDAGESWSVVNSRIVSVCLHYNLLTIIHQVVNSLVYY